MTDLCEHLSASGISQRALDDPSKVWRCDSCTLEEWVSVPVGLTGTHRQVQVEDYIAELSAENESLRRELLCTESDRTKAAVRRARNSAHDAADTVCQKHTAELLAAEEEIERLTSALNACRDAR